MKKIALSPIVDAHVCRNADQAKERAEEFAWEGSPEWHYERKEMIAVEDEDEGEKVIAEE